MKIANSIIVALVFCLLTNGNAFSETVHQTVQGASAYTGDGKKALDAKVIEVKITPDNVTVARVAGSVSQWGFVNFWFGQATPAGKVVLRFRIWVDDSTPADYGVYIHSLGDALQGKIAIPTDAKKNSFVYVEVPIDSPKEWNGLSLKKLDSSPNPSPWIDTVSVILP
jgi:hypothetical protein